MNVLFWDVVISVDYNFITSLCQGTLFECGDYSWL